MSNKLEQANRDLQAARDLRSGGMTYREIRRRLGLTVSQLGRIRRALKRERAGLTRLRSTEGASSRDLPISRSTLPSGLRSLLGAAGIRTLGDLADRFDERGIAGLNVIAGVGPHRARLMTDLLARYDLWPGSADLRAEVERLFPEFAELVPGSGPADRDAHDED
ncbi:hypothetical protein TPR58_06555 [Sphingomonas sp. HF-S3]|uniref:RNA polymerase alpha subunit C-terminal domain-containing protein n=1 Tax=Sphingomonas rustica TaxID=3103142 RepID=A0ABV0B5D8_9SPHN